MDRQTLKECTLRLLLLALFFVVVPMGILQFRPNGGELHMTDFIGGFDLYVEESHWFRALRNDSYIQPHRVWRVTDEDTKNNVYKLCKTMKCYRERDVAYDVMLGRADSYSNPRIYLITDRYGYNIVNLYWDNHASESWLGMPIRQQRYREPTLMVWRYRLPARTSGRAAYDYLREDTWGPDSMNTAEGNGWYSAMGQEEQDELLALLEGIDESCAEVYEDGVLD